jgi:hypothetical protein
MRDETEGASREIEAISVDAQGVCMRRVVSADRVRSSHVHARVRDDDGDEWRVVSSAPPCGLTIDRVHAFAFPPPLNEYLVPDDALLLRVARAATGAPLLDALAQLVASARAGRSTTPPTARRRQGVRAVGHDHAGGEDEVEDEDEDEDDKEEDEDEDEDDATVDAEAKVELEDEEIDEIDETAEIDETDTELDVGIESDASDALHEV